MANVSDQDTNAQNLNVDELDQLKRKDLELAQLEVAENEEGQPEAATDVDPAAGTGDGAAAGGASGGGAAGGATAGEVAGGAAATGGGIGTVGWVLGGLAALGGLAGGGGSGGGGGAGGGSGFDGTIGGGPSNAVPKANNGSANVIEDQTVSGQLDAVDDGALAYAFTKEVPGLTLNGDTGEYTFNAAQPEYQDIALNESRVIQVGYIATDAEGKSGQATLTITITGANDGPVAEEDVDGAVEDGAVIFGTVADNDSDADASDTLTYSLTDTVNPPPTGLTFNADGSYSFNPADYDNLTEGQLQVLNIGYSVSDGNGSVVTSQLKITITGTNDAPVANAVSESTTEDAVSALTGSLNSTGTTDADDASLTYAFTSSAPGLTLTNASTGEFSFDPSDDAYQGLGEGETQTVVVGYQVTDGQGATASSTLTISLTGKNDAPDVLDESAIATEDAALNGSVASNDSDVEGDSLTYALTGIAYTDAGGTVYSVASGLGFVLNTDGSYSLNTTGAAFQDLAVGVSSDITVDYTADDGTAAPVAGQLVISVSGTNDGPTASPVSTSATEGVAALVTGNLSASDVDQADTLTYSLDAPVAGLTVDSATGAFEFDAADAAYDSLADGEQEVITAHYSVADGNGGVSNSTLTLTVTGTNDAATISGTLAGTAVEDSGQTISGVAEASDVDNTDNIFTPGGGNATYGSYTVDSAGRWTYTLDDSNATVNALNTSSTALADSFVIESQDGTDQTISITINGANDAAVIGGAIVNGADQVLEQADGAGGDATATGTLTASDVDNADNTFQVVAAGAATASGYGTYGLTDAGDWTYTLDDAHTTVQELSAGETLTDSFTALSEDGTSQVVTITIDGASDSATFSGTLAGTAVEDSGQTISGVAEASDVDNTDNIFTPGGGNATYGSYTVDSAGRWTYTLDDSNATVNALNTSSTALADSFVIESQDGTDQTISITINGANDAAVIGGAIVNGADQVLEQADGAGGDATATGTLTASDVDNADNTFQVVAAGAATASGYGTYGLTDAGDWTYTLDDAHTTVQELSAGETLTDSFTALSEDGTSQVVTITIDGASDSATFSGTLAGTAVEDSGQTISGVAEASDVDNTDNIFTPGGGNATYGSYTVDSAGRWTYTLDDSNATVNALNTSSTALADSFVIESQDGTDQTISITINGANDAAVIGGAIVNGADQVLEQADGAGGDATATGTLTASDVDNADNTFQVVAAGAATASGYGTYGLTDAGDWTYTLDDAHTTVQELSAGETLTDSFTALSEDGTSQVVTITIDGASDSATFSGTLAGTAVEDSGQTISGVAEASDVDNTDNIFTPGGGNATYGSYTVDSAGRWTYTLDDSNATVNALNTSSTALADSFVIESQDGTDQTISITINGANDAAVIGGAIVNGADQVLEQADGAGGDATATGTLTASDVDNADNTFQVVAAGAATASGYGTYGLTDAGVWTYTLNDAHAAVQALNVGGTLTDSFTAVSEDGTTQVVTVTIDGANDTPIITGETVGEPGAEIYEGGAVFSGSIADNDTDVDNDELGYSISEIVVTEPDAANPGSTITTTYNLAPGAGEEQLDESVLADLGFSLTPEGIYTMDPTVDRYDILAGTDTTVLAITYEASDGAATPTGLLTLTVTGVNSLITNAAVTAFDHLGFTVEASDPDLNDTLEVVDLFQPTPNAANELDPNPVAPDHKKTFLVSTPEATNRLVDVVVTDNRGSTFDTIHTALIGSDAGESVTSEAARTFIAYGFAGNDTLVGGDKADLLVGGLGADSMNGGLGDDIIYGDSQDVTGAVIDGGDDNDTLKIIDPLFDDGAGTDGNLINVEDVVIVNSGTTVTLDDQSDDFTVTAHEGGEGGGTSTLNTGSGDYTVVTLNAADTVNINALAMLETDPDTFANRVLTLVGPGNFVVTGLHADLNAVAHTGSSLTVNTVDIGDNAIAILTGSAATTINSPTGAGTSNDTITVNATALPDDTTLTLTGDANFVVNSLQGDLSAGSVTGDINVTAVTSDVDQTITTGSGADTITAGAGDDTITAGAGTDFVTAGSGDDVVIIKDDADHTATETIDGGSNTADGDDEIRFTDGVGTLNLSANVSSVEVAKISDASGATTTTVNTGIDASGATSAGNIKLIGNNGANSLTGNAGHNEIIGNSGDDTILGNNGNDTITGGAGADNMQGGADNDVFLIASSSEHPAAEVINGDIGTDEIRFTTTNTVSVETLSLRAGVTNVETAKISDADGVTTGTVNASINASGATSAGNIALTGNDGNNSLTGNAGANTITGNKGDDTIDGREGADTLLGGEGNDVFIIINDAHHEVAGETIDGGSAIPGANPLEDVIRYTENSSDLLTLSSGVTNVETAMISNAAGATTTTNNAGIDISAVPVPTGNIALIGNNGNNILTGNGGVNAITGNNGNDTITGAGGVDSMSGGSGNDVFLIASNADHAAGETIDGGANTDDIRFTNSVETLALQAGVTNVESAEVSNAAGSNTGVTTAGIDASGATAAGNITLIGDNGANTLIGNAGNNQILGNNGDDAITGNAGDDTITGGAGADTINAGDGDDNIINFDGADQVDGGSNTDSTFFTGGTGVDSISLNSGTSGFLNGTAVGANTGAALDNAVTNIERVTAQGAGGSVTIDLSAQTEGFTGLSPESIPGFPPFFPPMTIANDFDGIIGSDGDDIITGSSGADEIYGGGENGNDTFINFVGADHIDGGANTTADQILLNSGTSDFLNGTATGAETGTTLDEAIINVERVSAENAAAAVTIDLSAQSEGFKGDESGVTPPDFDGIVGSDHDDTITGSSGADQIYGGDLDGNDTIIDFEGADHVDGGTHTLKDRILLNSGTSDFLNGTATGAETGATLDAAVVNIEQVSAENASQAVTIDLSAQSEGFRGDVAVDHDGIVGSDHDDRIIGSDVADDQINGGLGNDTIVVIDTQDDIEGGAGSDTLEVNRADYIGADTGLLTGVENVTLISNTGDNYEVDLRTQSLDEEFTITGGDGDDILRGGIVIAANGGDIIDGGAGNDIIEGSIGKDTLTGGAGNDDFVYNSADSSGQIGTSDTITDFATGADEIVVQINGAFTGIGPVSEFNGLSFEVVAGRTAGESGLGGGDGDGFYNSGDGELIFDLNNDGLINSADMRILTAPVAADDIRFDITGSDSDDDIIAGGRSDDVLRGGGGDDELIGGTGDDRLEGGEGSDTANYNFPFAASPSAFGANYNDSKAVVVDLNVGFDVVAGAFFGTASRVAFGDEDRLYSIENVSGSEEADQITGDNGSNILAGNDGNDTISGEGGNDRIIGGEGSDSLSGGLGNNTYVFETNDVGSTETVTFDPLGGTETFEVNSSTDFQDLNAGGSLSGLNVLNLTTTAVNVSFTAAQLDGLTLTINGSGNDTTNVVTVNGPGDGIVDLSGITLNNASLVYNPNGGTDTVILPLGSVNTSGGAGDDTFVVNSEDLTSATTINGQGHVAGDILRLGNYTTNDATNKVSDVDFTNISNIEILELHGTPPGGNNEVVLGNEAELAGFTSVLGDGGNDTIDVVAMTSNISLVGGAGNDTFKFTSSELQAGDSVDGGGHVMGVGDTLELTGDATDAVFSGVTNVERLNLDDVANTVAVANNFLFVNGGSAADNIDATGNTQALDVTGGGGSDTFQFAANQLTSADSVNGGTSGLDVDTLQLSGAATGLRFDNHFSGVSQVEALVLDNQVNSVVVENIFLTVTGGTVSDTIDARDNSQALNIQAGTGADLIQFAAGALTSADEVNGGGDADVLQLTGAATSLTVAVNFFNVSNVETLELDAAVNNSVEVGDKFSTVIGGTGADTIDASNNTAGITLNGGDGASTAVDFLTGGTGNDTLNGGIEDNVTDIMTGGAGVDTFQLADGQSGSYGGEPAIPTPPPAGTFITFLDNQIDKIVDLEPADVVQIVAAGATTATLTGTYNGAGTFEVNGGTNMDTLYYDSNSLGGPTPDDQITVYGIHDA